MESADHGVTIGAVFRRREYLFEGGCERWGRELIAGGAPPGG